MDKKEIIKTLKELKDNSKKRNFTQSIDLVFTLKDLNLKKPTEQLDQFITLPHSYGKKPKVCAFISSESVEGVEPFVDKYILVDDFESFKGKNREIRKLAGSYDFFIAQANLMPKVAAVFGRFFGSRGKLPNPKLGTIIAPKTNIKTLVEKLAKTVRFRAKTSMVSQSKVAVETMNNEEIAENVLFVYDQLVHHLPKERHNLKVCYLKLSMGKAFNLKL